MFLKGEGSIMSVSFAKMKKKWEKRKQARIKEEAKRKEEETKRKAVEEANRPKPRIPHYGGVISTNKDASVRKFLLRKWGKEGELSETQKKALEHAKNSLNIKSLSQVKKEIKTIQRKKEFKIIRNVPNLVVNKDKLDESQGKHENSPKVITLSHTPSGSKGNRNSGERKRKRGNVQDDFLSTDLDTLAGIAPSRKKKYSKKMKLSQKKKKKRLIQSNRKMQEKRKQGKSSGGRKNFSFLAKGLDEI